MINDSCCPENLNFIWAGECEIEVAIYKNKKLISIENVLISPKLQKGNIALFSKYYPDFKIKDIGICHNQKTKLLSIPKIFL